MDKKAQVGRNIIYLIVGFIVLIGVAIPISKQIISSANLTGISRLVLTYVPVFLAVAGLILAIAMSGIKA